MACYGVLRRVTVCTSVQSQGGYLVLDFGVFHHHSSFLTRATLTVVIFFLSAFLRSQLSILYAVLSTLNKFNMSSCQQPPSSLSTPHSAYFRGDMVSGIRRVVLERPNLKLRPPQQWANS